MCRGTAERSLTCFLGTCELTAQRCACNGTAAKSVSTLQRNIVPDIKPLRDVSATERWQKNSMKEIPFTSTTSSKVCTSKNNTTHHTSKPPERRKLFIHLYRDEKNFIQLVTNTSAKNLDDMLAVCQ